MSRRDFLKHLGFHQTPTLMSNNTQLPAELAEQIKTRASYISGHSPDEDSTPFRNGMYSGFISGATEYATKLIQCDKANSALEEKNRGLEEENNKLKDQIEKYVLDGRDKEFKGRTLLEKIYEFHGHAPYLDKSTGNWLSKEIFTEIKTFLDGTK